MSLYSRLTDNAKVCLFRYSLEYPSTAKRLEKNLKSIGHVNELTLWDLNVMFFASITKVLPNDHEIMIELDFIRSRNQNAAL